MKIYKPEKDTYYTFIYEDGQELTFKYLSTNEKGRYIMLLIKNDKNEFVDMSEKRFSFLYHKQLVKEAKISDIKNEIERAEAERKAQEEIKRAEEEKKFNEELKETCAWLKRLDWLDIQTIKSKLGVHPHALADDILGTSGLEQIEYLLVAEKIQKIL
ncbi:MAG: hypothetical protein IJY57_01150 [Clostridia bacterium]|nr:hypothetical protein [Clostridia bacterium]